MSVSMWAYLPGECDGGGCPGDCDLCSKPMEMEDEQTDYIKREDAIRTMTGRPIIVNQGNVEAVTRIYEEFVKRIDDIPAADVVEVVRCKDCKHYKRNIPCVGGHYNGCDEWIDEGNAITVYDNDFCSYGERADT